MYERLNVPTLGVIENMSYYLCPKCGHREDIFDSGGAQQAAGSMNVPFLGAIPLNASIRRYSDAGTPEKNFLEDGDKHVRDALDGIVGALVDQVRVRDESGGGSPTISFE
jgi:ATP-binding protein involved in chromosome partitioning